MTLLQCKYGLFELDPGDSEVVRSLHLYGEWDERQIALMRRFLFAGSVVADIGASIGAEAVAFARIVGDRGRVHAFAVRPEFVPVLERNIVLNQLGAAVSVHGTVAALASGSVNLPGVDVIRIGMDVDAVELLRRVQKTIAYCQPIIVADRRSVRDDAGLLSWAEASGYRVFVHRDYAFNPENYRGNPHNIFGDAERTMLILIPSAALGQTDLRDLEPLQDQAGVRRSQDLLRSSAGAVGRESQRARHGAASSMREALVGPDLEPLRQAGTSACAGRAVHIVVPFYKQAELVAPVFNSLNAISDEIRAIGGKVFFYNDSPDHPPLQDALDRCRMDDSSVEFTVVRNPANLGFIGTCNVAFAKARGDRADVILLNSDTIVFPGALTEMLQVGALDPMIGFVSPRSNNATLATLPHSSLDCDVSPQAGYAAFLRHAASLPRYIYVPTAVGFCLLVKWSVYSELGTFDPVYGAGYNEENDLIMRANRAGYRAVLANKAFVWHKGEQSFGKSPQAKKDREEKNASILNSRYPEYLPSIHAYFSSPEYRAEDLIEYAAGVDGEPTIAFDFSTFGAYFNGTFESGVKLLEASTRTWPPQCRIAVYMDPAAWKFHGLDRLERVSRLDVHDASAKVAAILRIGQPFDVYTVQRIANRAPVLGIFMLDTIAYDCTYLAQTFDANIWRHVFEHVDVLFTNSRFTLDRIASRFKLGARVMRRVSRHSLDVTEYAQAKERTAGAEPHIFVIGNHFSHKFVRPTADALAQAFPQRKIVAVGYGDPSPQYPNIESHESGNLSNETFERFYSDAEAVIFPSHYEGFGFPILHSLARERPIYVRDSALYRELASDIAGSENVHYFCTTDALVDDLRLNGVRWEAPRKAGEQQGWERSAREVFYALEQARATLSYDALVDRLRDLDQLAAATPGKTVAATSPTRVVAHKVEVTLERLLRVPGVRPVARRAWHVARRLRAAR